VTRVPVRVRYSETDRMGVAYHAHYLVWFEMARTELMREAGCTYREVEDHDGILFPVIQVGARYLRSARYDEQLEVVARLTSVGRARVRFDYELRRVDGGAPLASGFTAHAAVGRDGRPTGIPAEVRRRLQSRESSE